MFATVLLAKAKHIVKSRVSVGGDYPKLGYWEVWTNWDLNCNSPPQHEVETYREAMDDLSELTGK